MNTELKAIFKKPGCQWFEEERDRVYFWLLEDKQNHLTLFASDNLGKGTTKEDAEDLFTEFFTTRIDSVIMNYDPEKGAKFWSYLLACLRNACFREGKNIRKRIKDNVPLTTLEKTEEIQLIHLVSAPDDELMYEELINVLKSCIESLPFKYRMAFIKFHIQGLSVKEMADDLGISESNVKARRLRMREMLATCLKKKGWDI